MAVPFALAQVLGYAPLLTYAESSAVGLKQGHHVCWAQETAGSKALHPLQCGGSSWQLGIKLGGRRNGPEHTPKLGGRHRSAYPKKPLELAQEQLDRWGSPSHHHLGIGMGTGGATLTHSGSSSACTRMRVNEFVS